MKYSKQELFADDMKNWFQERGWKLADHPYDNGYSYIVHDDGIKVFKRSDAGEEYIGFFKPYPEPTAEQIKNYTQQY